QIIQFFSLAQKKKNPAGVQQVAEHKNQKHVDFIVEHQQRINNDEQEVDKNPQYRVHDESLYSVMVANADKEVTYHLSFKKRNGQLHGFSQKVADHTHIHAL